MVVVKTSLIHFTDQKSNRGLGVVLELNNVARCRTCGIAVRLEGDRITCSECHRWRQIEQKG